jgi:hypothetical protein
MRRGADTSLLAYNIILCASNHEIDRTDNKFIIIIIIIMAVDDAAAIVRKSLYF